MIMIRNAKFEDTPAINNLLRQVLDVHAEKRPDIFKVGTAKYSDEKLQTIIQNPATPIFVAVNFQGEVVGYAFCQYRNIEGSAMLHDIKYCYIDDICVDKAVRGQGVGTKLYEYVKQQAQADGYTAIRLNVWCLNDTAIRFYQKLGLEPLSMIMEQNI